MTPVLRVANFMDSALEKLEQKGNLSHAVALYNPRGIAEKVIHFTPPAMHGSPNSSNINVSRFILSSIPQPKGI